MNTGVKDVIPSAEAPRKKGAVINVEPRCQAQSFL